MRCLRIVIDRVGKLSIVFMLKLIPILFFSLVLLCTLIPFFLDTTFTTFAIVFISLVSLIVAIIFALSTACCTFGISNFDSQRW